MCLIVKLHAHVFLNVKPVGASSNQQALKGVKVIAYRICRRHPFVMYRQQKGSTKVFHNVTSYKILLLATCFGFWKRHHRAIKNMHGGG